MTSALQVSAESPDGQRECLVSAMPQQALRSDTTPLDAAGFAAKQGLHENALISNRMMGSTSANSVYQVASRVTAIVVPRQPC